VSPDRARAPSKSRAAAAGPGFRVTVMGLGRTALAVRQPLINGVNPRPPVVRPQPKLEFSSICGYAFEGEAAPPGPWATPLLTTNRGRRDQWLPEV
jgi:hypothetical protein